MPRPFRQPSCAFPLRFEKIEAEPARVVAGRFFPHGLATLPDARPSPAEPTIYPLMRSAGDTASYGVYQIGEV